MRHIGVWMLCFLPFLSYGQPPFSVAFELQGYSGFHNLTTTYDGGYVFCTDGEMQAPNYGYLVKLDSTGTQQWVTRYQKTNWSVAISDGNAVVQTQDSGFAVATMWFHRDSVTMDYGYSARLIKTDDQGNVLWSMLYPGLGYSMFFDVKETSDHGFIACGKTMTVSSSNWKAFIVRTDSVGNVLWANTYESSTPVYLQSIMQASTGDFMVCGGISADGLLLKINSSGAVVWSRRCSNSSVQTDIQETSLGGFITCGYNPGYTYTTLYAFDAFGGSQWAKGYKAGQAFVAVQMIPVANGYTLVSDGSNNGPIGMGQIDFNGNPIWARAYLGFNANMNPSIVRSNDGGYVFTAARDDGTTSYDISVVVTKTDSLGVAFCNDSIVSDTTVSLPVAVAGVVLTVGNADSSIVFTTIATGVTVNPSPVCVMTHQPMIDAKTDEVLVYPNPTNDRITVATQLSGTGLKRIRLCDVTGRVVLDEEMISDQHQIDLSSLNPGLYFLLLEQNGVLIAQKPVIRN